MKVKLLKILSYGWTNILYLGISNSKEVVVKYFHFNLRTFSLFIVYVIASLLRLEIPPPLPIRPKSRKKNEVKANRILKKLKIKVPKIVFSNNSIVMEKIDGLNMHEFLKKVEDVKLLRKIAFMKGLEIAKLHKNGCAFVDNKAANTIITESLELYSVDHEFFCEKAKKFQRELDFITLASSLPAEKYDEFWKSFCLGYKKIRKRTPEIKRKDILGLSMIGFNLMHLFGFW